MYRPSESFDCRRVCVERFPAEESYGFHFSRGRMPTCRGSSSRAPGPRGTGRRPSNTRLFRQMLSDTSNQVSTSRIRQTAVMPEEQVGLSETSSGPAGVVHGLVLVKHRKGWVPGPILPFDAENRRVRG